MNPQSILIVDDDNGSARLLLSYLAPSGYEVLVVYEERSALQTMQSNKPDLLVLKGRLSDRDGLEVMGIIRSHPLLADLPIIIISNYGSAEDRAVGLERGPMIISSGHSPVMSSWRGYGPCCGVVIRKVVSQSIGSANCIQISIWMNSSLTLNIWKASALK